MPVGITISILGLLGNALSIFIWLKIIKKNFGGNKSTAIYLVALAVIDSGLLVFFLTDDSLPKLAPSLLTKASFCYFHSYVGFPFFFFCIAASIWLLVCVSLNRFIMVSFPVKAKTLCSTTRAYIGIGGTLLCCFLVNIPHFLNYRPINAPGKSCISDTDYGKNLAPGYEFWVHCIFLVLAPWAAIAFFNGGIIYALHKRAKKMSSKTSKPNDRQSQDRQMTMMLLVVTFTFLLLLAWQCITQCFWMLKVGFDNKVDRSMWIRIDKSFALAKLGVVINSSINFLLYSCTGSIFRKELISMFTTERSRNYMTGSSTSVGTKLTNQSMTLSVAESQN